MRDGTGTFEFPIETRRADGGNTRTERATRGLPASATIGACLVSTVLNAAAAFGLVVFVDDRPAFVTRVAAPHQRDGPGLNGLLETNGRNRAAAFAPIGKSKPQHSRTSLSRDSELTDTPSSRACRQRGASASAVGIRIPCGIVCREIDPIDRNAARPRRNCAGTALES